MNQTVFANLKKGNSWMKIEGGSRWARMGLAKFDFERKYMCCCHVDFGNCFSC